MTPLIYSFFLLWFIGLCTLIYEVAKTAHNIWIKGFFKGDIISTINLD